MRPKYIWLVTAAVAAFLILVMQVRVGDKDEQIGDLRNENVALASEADGLLEYNKDLRFKLTSTENDVTFLLELQDATASWGECLERWGTQLSQESAEAAATKTRCDTRLAEMEKLFVEGD